MKASGEKHEKNKLKLYHLDLHQICIISKEGACCNVLDIMYLDNYNKIVFECKKKNVFLNTSHIFKHIF